MRRLNLPSVAGTAIALLVFGAVVLTGCNEPATRATTATDAAADQTTPAQVAVTTGSGPGVDSSPTTEPTAKVTTAKNPTAERQPPVQPVKTNSPGPADDSVPPDGQPVQVATVLEPPLPDAEQASITTDSGPEVDSIPPADPPALLATSPVSVLNEEAPAQVGATTTSEPADDQGPSTDPADQIVFQPVAAPGQKDPAHFDATADIETKDTDKGGESSQGQTYTWEDGDRTLTVQLQTDLVVQKSADSSAGDIVAANVGEGSVVKRDAGAQAKSDDQPVFRSESGRLMTLPGGVLLVLDPEWSQAQVNSFFSANGIKLDRVSELDYVDNGFLVETEPGFPSLELANTLAALEGVAVSSPNWSRESTPK